jgi:hypothetical protein
MKTNTTAIFIIYFERKTFGNEILFNVRAQAKQQQFLFQKTSIHVEKHVVADDMEQSAILTIHVDCHRSTD